MFYLIPTLCLVVCTYFVARFFAVKTRFAERGIEEAIARKLAAAGANKEIQRLREENGVMINLLRDMIENEAIGAIAAIDEERERIARAKTMRRREIFGEAVYVLRQSEKASDAGITAKITG